jgi:hypothetical protein
MQKGLTSIHGNSEYTTDFYELCCDVIRAIRFFYEQNKISEREFLTVLQECENHISCKLLRTHDKQCDWI